MTDTKMVLWLTLAWAAAAYLIVPRLWLLYFRRHPVLAELARVTQTSDGHPGDPINVALVGSDAEVVRGMAAAGWFPADPITLATSVRIVADSVLRRSDVDAPVSNLFLFSRKQDLAFEEPVGNSPRQRHDVRFCVPGTPTVAWRSWCCAVPLRTREGECSDRPRRNERRERQCVARQRR